MSSVCQLTSYTLSFKNTTNVLSNLSVTNKVTSKGKFSKYLIVLNILVSHRWWNYDNYSPNLTTEDIIVATGKNHTD